METVLSAARIAAPMISVSMMKAEQLCRTEQYGTRLGAHDAPSKRGTRL